MSYAPVALISLSDIEAAATRIQGVAYRTPLIPYVHGGLDRAYSPRLYFKPELFQPMGAFKLRGAFNAIAALSPEQRAQGVIAYSSGNHAQGVAYAARHFGIPAIIVMPTTAPRAKIDGTRGYGAEVVLYDPASEQREVVAARITAERNVDLPLIPPYDHPHVIAGQGTIGLEIAQDLPDVELVLMCVGGGGLISGVATAIKALAPNAKVVGVEPELADDAAQSFHTGRIVHLTSAETERTLADGVRTLEVSPLTFAHMQAYVDDMITVSETELRQATRELILNAKIAVEPTAALPMAAYLYHHDQLPRTKNVVIVLTGGNSDPETLASILLGTPEHSTYSSNS